MSNKNTELFERGFLEWVAQDAVDRLVRSAPPGHRDAVARRAREEVGKLLIHAPLGEDPVADIRARSEIAAAFGVAYSGHDHSG